MPLTANNQCSCADMGVCKKEKNNPFSWLQNGYITPLIPTMLVMQK